MKTCEECERLREGMRLYVILRDKQQFAPPDVFERIRQFAGIPYQPGYLISSYIRRMEEALGIKP